MGKSRTPEPTTKIHGISAWREPLAGYSAWDTARESVFDEAEALRAVEFFPRFLKHVKGECAGKPLYLEKWEEQLVANVFGWKRPDGSRRYRTVYCEVPRKNGKTTVAAGFALLLLMCDSEAGAEVYSAAGSADQAGLCFDIARCMVEASPKLAKIAKINNSIADRSIRVPATNSVYRVIPAKPGTGHGLSPSGIIFDELHTQPNGDLWNNLQTGIGYRRQPLTLALTTAGTDKESLCYEKHSDAQKVRDGSLDDESFFPVIYAASEKDDWRSPETWAKANPNFGISIKESYLREACERAKRVPSEENAFKNLHLNLWTDTETRWIGSESWNACELARAEWPDLSKGVTVGGLDLGSVDDLTAFVAVTKLDGKFYVRRRTWVPSETVFRGRKAYQKRYQAWATAGLLDVVEGKAQHYGPIRDAIREERTYSGMRIVAFDPHNAMDTATQLEGEAFEFVKVNQSHAGMAMGTKACETAVLNGHLVHDGDPVLKWMVSCSSITTDHAGNGKPDKQASQGADGTRGKIDAVVAMVMAFGVLVNQPERNVCGSLFLVG